MESIRINELYNLKESIAGDYLAKYSYPWEALNGICDYIKELGPSLDKNIYEKKGDDIWIAKSATIAPTACLQGPLIVDEAAEIRHCAYIRGSAIIGKHAVVGNSTEVKNSIIFNEVQIPHFNYVGDSILGFRSHMGAGSITSNIKSDRSWIVIRDFYENKVEIATGMKKIGAMLGDYVEVGCNTVLNPGTVVGKNSNIYPLSRVRGIIPNNSIYKNENRMIKKQEV